MLCSDIANDLAESSSPHIIYNVCPDPNMILFNISYYQMQYKTLQLFLDLDKNFECGGSWDIFINQTKVTIFTTDQWLFRKTH